MKSKWILTAALAVLTCLPQDARSRPSSPKDFLPTHAARWQWPESSKGDLKRRVFSIWSSQEHKEIYNSPVIRHVESVLNHMGVHVEYVDVDAEVLPDPDATWADRYAGLITAFDGENLPAGEKIYDWMLKFERTGLPWVALGRFGFLEKVPKSKLIHLFERYKVGYAGLDHSPSLFKIVGKDSEWMEFERKISPLASEFPPFEAKTTKGFRVGLRLRARGAEYDSTPVFLSERISVAYGPYGLYSDLSAGRRMWVVNPFRFLRVAFSLDPRIPVPDVNAINGRRVYYSHIDGDAFASVSWIKGDDGQPRYCGEVMADRVLRRYPTLPVGVSIIVAEVDSRHRGNDRLVESAKQVVADPNVEVASHTYTHPLYWKEGKVAYPFFGQSYDEKFETVESIKYIEQRIAGSKPVEVLYWSGDCMPKKVALDHLSQAGYLNMNGGDSQFDSDYPSYAHVSPLGRPLGERYQVFAANANDNIYTRGWEGPYHGFRKAIETFRNTGEPVLFKPINPYYHFFSAERESGVRAVIDAIEWALREEISPVFPSVYVRSVLGHRTVRVEARSESEFVVRNAQGLFTLRLDHHRGLVPNFRRSTGILGYRVLKDSLYIHLDPDAEGEVRIALQAHRRGGAVPYLRSVGGVVRNARFSKSHVAMRIEPFTRGPLVLGDARSGKWKAVIGGARKKDLVSRNGELNVPFEADVRARELELVFDEGRS